MIPPSVYESVITQMLAACGNPKYVVQQGMIIIDGKTLTDAVPISFMFNNYWMTIDPEDYLLDVSRANDGS
jgi:hypothetical protein